MDIKGDLAEHLALNTAPTKHAAMFAVNRAFNHVGGDQAALEDPPKTANAVSDAARSSAENHR